MIAKKYVVKTIDEVQKLIAEELGPSAVILTSKQIRYKGWKSFFFADKVEVVAAVEENDYQKFQEFKKSHRENTPESHEWESPIQTLTENNERETDKDLTGLEEPSNYEASPIMGTYLDPRFNRKMANEERNSLREQNYGEIEDLANGLIEKFGYIIYNQSNESIEIPSEIPVSENLTSPLLLNYLARCGLSQTLAKTIDSKLDDRFKRTEPPSKEWKETLENAKAEVSALIKVHGPICLSAQKPLLVALIGGRDCGKTTVAMQIALQYMLEIGNRVAVLSQTPKLLEEKEWIKGFAESFFVPLSFFENSSELKEGLENYKDKSLILIDTCGLPFEVISILNELNDIQIQLVLSCASKDIDSMAIYQQYRKLKIDALIFTKLDETVSRGSLLNIATATGLPISYASFGRNIPDDLWIADPKNLANAIFETTDESVDSIQEVLYTL